MAVASLGLMGLGSQTRAQGVSPQAMMVMKKQIAALQAQLATMERQQAAENKRVREALKRQRESLEADPFAPGGENVTPAGLSQPHLLKEGSPAARLVDSKRIPRSESFFDTFGAPGGNLAPSQTAETPYGEITALPPSHPDLYGPLRRGQLQIGGIRLTLGGFFEAAGIWRRRTTGSDLASSFMATPWGNEPAYHLSNWQQTERSSRLSVLAEGMITHKLVADGYVEIDFQAAGASANSHESDSYSPRARVIYGELKDIKDGWFFLGGQNWSLLTPYGHGLLARDEQIPITIDTDLLPGFNWTRAPQLRVVKSFDQAEDYSLGLSIESPSQASSNPKQAWIAPGHRITDGVKGTSTNNPDAAYSANPYPDTVLKFAADPGWGHYEIAGLMRYFRTRNSWAGGGRNQTVVGGGGGGSMVVPIIPDRLFFRASGMVGKGIGRYGSAGFPDYTFGRHGQPVPLPEASLLVGLWGNPTPALRLYMYGGAEEVLGRRSFNVGTGAYGYGNRRYDMGGCGVELSTNCAASSNVRLSAEATAGFWYTAARGDYGSILVGAQYAHNYLEAFSGSGGKPHTDDDVVMMSFRYMPFN
ncbi:hypothetical protein [Oecophyllibacter saccharovorans]|uniref:Porin n=1 Tax=Oecophyllibacter saccharovorans TaxID=2558360 RepID=A0A506UKN9_9PROT|nr:hypothetical protein [Oecophyllibacter saccharovorans]TPW33924.1 hypothetical protein E3202_04880 [Oecophyllibacter saccharovorans]